MKKKKKYAIKYCTIEAYKTHPKVHFLGLEDSSHILRIKKTRMEI